MSVVNKMLQDLESRKQQPDTANFQPPAKRRHGWWLFGVLPLALMLAVIYWFWPVLWDAGEPEPPPGPATQTGQTMPVQNPLPAERAGLTAKPQTQPEKKHESGITDTTAQPQVIPQQPVADSATAAEAGQVSATRADDSGPDAATAPRPQPDDAGQSAPESPVQKTPAFSKSKTTTTAEQRWQQLKARVSKAMNEGKDAGAISGLEQMLEIQPDNHQVRRNLAALLLKNGAQSRSGLLLEQGVKLYPQELSLLQSLARFYAQNGQTDNALALLKGHNPDVLQHPDYIQLRARLAKQQQDHHQAQQDYALLSRYQPDNIKWRLGLAVSLDQDGQYQAATEVYRWLAGADTPAEIREFVQQRLTALGG
jgi:MSHA biogenesis protein MshN